MLSGTPCIYIYILNSFAYWDTLYVTTQSSRLLGHLVYIYSIPMLIGTACIHIYSIPMLLGTPCIYIYDQFPCLLGHPVYIYTINSHTYWYILHTVYIYSIPMLVGTSCIVIYLLNSHVIPPYI